MFLKMQFLVLVPAALIFVGAFFGIASPARALAAFIVLVGGLFIYLFTADMSGTHAVLLLIFGGIFIATAPTVAVLVGFTAKPVCPSPAEQTFSYAKERYQNLSPEQKELLKRACAKTAKAGAKVFAEHLRTKGRHNLAAGIDEIVGK